MSDLSRFGVAMETSLLTQFDQLVRERGSSRSELFRDLARGELMRSLSRKRVDAFASVTIVYNHHVRELSERITDMQHDLGDQVRSTMHVHLDHDRCLEIIVMRGRADKLQLAAEKLFATRGILHGAIEIVAVTQPPADTHAFDAKGDYHGSHTHPRRPRARPRGPRSRRGG